MTTVTEPSAADTASDATVAAPSRRRRTVRLLVLAVVAIAVASGTAFLIKVGSEKAIGWNGGSFGVRGSDAVTHSDPFGNEPFGSWAEVKFQPGGTVTLGFTITNVSHTQTITLRSITFDGVAGTPTDHESAISHAALSVDHAAATGTDVQPFQPFRLGPGSQAYLQWTFTMCSAGTPSNGGAVEYQDFAVGYSYFGFHKHQTLPLGLPLQIDNVTFCS